jgi:hypothetical protein
MNKEVLAYKLLNIIQSNVSLLDDVNLNKLSGINHLMDTLYDDDNNDRYKLDVNIALNTCIEILTEIESRISVAEQNQFDDICQATIYNNELESFKQGDLVVYDDLPYIVSEVNLDDSTIHIYSGQIDDNGMWLEGYDILKLKK